MSAPPTPSLVEDWLLRPDWGWISSSIFVVTPFLNPSVLTTTFTSEGFSVSLYEWVSALTRSPPDRLKIRPEVIVGWPVSWQSETRSQKDRHFVPYTWFPKECCESRGFNILIHHRKENQKNPLNYTFFLISTTSTTKGLSVINVMS